MKAVVQKSLTCAKEGQVLLVKICILKQNYSFHFQLIRAVPQPNGKFKIQTLPMPGCHVDSTVLERAEDLGQLICSAPTQDVPFHDLPLKEKQKLIDHLIYQRELARVMLNEHGGCPACGLEAKPISKIKNKHQMQV